MTQENKELLLKDLSARLMYGVKVVRYIERNNKVEQLIPEMDLSLRLFELLSNQWFIIRPYLRPMSSMTEEERQEYEATCTDWYETLETYDWLNAHHFDYRGLIEKGLALEAPEGMYILNK